MAFGHLSYNCRAHLYLALGDGDTKEYHHQIKHIMVAKCKEIVIIISFSYIIVQERNSSSWDHKIKEKKQVLFVFALVENGSTQKEHALFYV